MKVQKLILYGVLTLTQGQIIGYQGQNHPTPRAIYEYQFNDTIKYIAIQISNNGYIVSANPRSASRLR